MKTFALLSILLLIVNCSSIDEIPTYNPSSGVGCSEYVQTKERLSCIGNLVKQLENIQNAKILIEKQKLDRLDSEFVNYKFTYCFADNLGKEKYLCFETIKKEYDPTVVGIIIDWSKKLGIGAAIGFVGGVYIFN